MKEIPILYSGAMVRALLAGDKTQTRRIIKPQPPDYIAPATFPNRDSQGWSSSLRHTHGNSTAHFCPYGQPGGALWVRETWAEVGAMAPGLIVFRANYPACVPAQYENVPPAEAIKWKPSIHMPRAASRILLEVTAVRVERLKDISCADARAEGAETYLYECYDFDYKVAPELANYRRIWESLYGTGSWDANPWVWVVEFRRISKEMHQ